MKSFKQFLSEEYKSVNLEIGQRPLTIELDLGDKKPIKLNLKNNDQHTQLGKAIYNALAEALGKTEAGIKFKNSYEEQFDKSVFDIQAKKAGDGYEFQIFPDDKSKQPQIVPWNFIDPKFRKQIEELMVGVK